MKKNTIPHIPKNKNKKEINKIKYKKTNGTEKFKPQPTKSPYL